MNYRNLKLYFLTLFLLGCAGVIALQRQFLTIFTGQLAFTLGLALLLAVTIEPVVRWVVRSDTRAGPLAAWLRWQWTLAPRNNRDAPQKITNAGVNRKLSFPTQRSKSRSGLNALRRR